MDKEKDILNQLGNLPTLEPSADWDAGLFEKLNRSKEAQSDEFYKKTVSFVVAILFIVNALSFVQNWKAEQQQANKRQLVSIASEILIN